MQKHKNEKEGIFCEELQLRMNFLTTLRGYLWALSHPHQILIKVGEQHKMPQKAAYREEPVVTIPEDRCIVYRILLALLLQLSCRIKESTSGVEGHHNL